MIRDLIDAIAEGNTLAIDDSFNAVMASKISERLDDLRVSVAQNVFGSVKESVELDEAVGTAAKYAGKTGLMGGKYKSTDKAIELTGDKFNAWRAKQSAKKSAEHKGQDPKLAAAGYGKHMVDIEKAKKNADARGVDASHLNWKHRNGVTSRKLPEEFDLDEAREERGDMGTDNSPKGSARGSSLHSMDIAKQSGYTHAVMHMGAKGGIDSYHTTKAGADKKLALLRKKHNIPENSPRARIAEL